MLLSIQGTFIPSASGEYAVAPLLKALCDEGYSDEEIIEACDSASLNYTQVGELVYMPLSQINDLVKEFDLDLEWELSNLIDSVSAHQGPGMLSTDFRGLPLEPAVTVGELPEPVETAEPTETAAPADTVRFTLPLADLPGESFRIRQKEVFILNYRPVTVRKFDGVNHFDIVELIYASTLRPQSPSILEELLYSLHSHNFRYVIQTQEGFWVDTEHAAEVLVGVGVYSSQATCAARALRVYDDSEGATNCFNHWGELA